MAIDNFEQYEDIYREIPLTIGGEAVDTDNFLTITVSVYHKKNKTEIGSYSVTGGTVTKEVPTTDGKISFIVSKTENKDATIGIYTHEVTTTETDVDYEGGIRQRKLIGDCFNLIKSQKR